jgi:outer membrane protein assembly factor BamD (BamD/ComL family)
MLNLETEKIGFIYWLIGLQTFHQRDRRDRDVEATKLKFNTFCLEDWIICQFLFFLN